MYLVKLFMHCLFFMHIYYTMHAENNATLPVNTEVLEERSYCNFEGIQGKLLLEWISDYFAISIMDPLLNPHDAIKKFLDSKFTFQSHTRMSKKELWDTCTLFLDFFDLTLLQIPHSKTYALIPKATAINNGKNILKTYINTAPESIAENSELIRYIHFLKNIKTDAIRTLIDHCKSTSGTVTYLEKNNCFILVDSGENIKSLIALIQAIDNRSNIEIVSVIRLKNINAEDIVQTYQKLVPKKSETLVTKFSTPKQASYFSNNVSIIAEPRLNLLILIGPEEEVKKVEDLVIKYLDIIPTDGENPIKGYKLHYIMAKEAVTVLNHMFKDLHLKKNITTDQPIILAAEEETNSIVASASKTGHELLQQTIKEIDLPQPQVAVNVLLLSIDQQKSRELGSQIRNKDRSTISKNVDFQTSGLPLLTGGSTPIVENNSLMANLISLAAFQEPGALLLSILNPANGVWALFKVLQDYTDAAIISNPFLIATHKKEALLVIGETRRPITATFTSIVADPAFADLNANLTVKIVPRINSLGMVHLDIALSVETFTDPANPLSANKTIRSIYTSALLGNNQVLAIGGIARTQKIISKNQVPILGDIPIFGWLFNNQSQRDVKDNIIAFISVSVLNSAEKKTMHTKEKIEDVYNGIDDQKAEIQQKDPIHRYFFKDTIKNTSRQIDTFIDDTNIPTTEFKRHYQEINNQCISKNKTILVPCEEIQKVNEC